MDGAARVVSAMQVLGEGQWQDHFADALATAYRSDLVEFAETVMFQEPAQSSGRMPGNAGDSRVI